MAALLTRRSGTPHAAIAGGWAWGGLGRHPLTLGQHEPLARRSGALRVGGLQCELRRQGDRKPRPCCPGSHLAARVHSGPDEKLVC